jgi:hypothetical protein
VLTQVPNMPATSKGTAHASARANITSPTQGSTLATIRNNQRPYHRKAQGRGLRYALKYLDLAANGKRQTAPNSEGRLLPRNPPPIELQTIGQGEPHSARISEHHSARISEHHSARISEHRLRPPRARVKNWRGRVGYILWAKPSIPGCLASYAKKAAREAV